MKIKGCRNSDVDSERNTQIIRLELMRKFITTENEYWCPLPENPRYLLSNHGRVISLNSYAGKKKILCPSVKLGKYLYYTITVNGTRKCLSIYKLKRIIN